MKQPFGDVVLMLMADAHSQNRTIEQELSPSLMFFQSEMFDPTRFRSCEAKSTLKQSFSGAWPYRDQTWPGGSSRVSQTCQAHVLNPERSRP